MTSAVVVLFRYLSQWRSKTGINARVDQRRGNLKRGKYRVEDFPVVYLASPPLSSPELSSYIESRARGGGDSVLAPKDEISRVRFM